MIEYAVRIWGLRVTDVNQGVVYGHRNGTRLDVDEAFGTVINRFVAQAVVGIPLTIYGEGGQTRGFINLQNSLEAITLLGNNPVEAGEFRVIHQTTQEYSVKEIAEMVQMFTGCEIQHVDNPRVEMDENKFTFDTSTLDNLGLVPVTLKEELPRLIKVMEENKDRIIKEAILPKTNWR
jgi:UDP-sulfoquinovose synthase